MEYQFNHFGSITWVVVDILNTNTWRNSIKLTHFLEEVIQKIESFEESSGMLLIFHESYGKNFIWFWKFKKRIQGRINKLDKNSMKAFLGGVIYNKPVTPLAGFTSNVLYDRHVLGVVAEFLSLE